MSEPKTPSVQKNYTTPQNIWYVISRAAKWDSFFLPLLLMWCVCETAVSYNWTIFSKLVIDRVTSMGSTSGLILLVAAAASVQLILTLFNAIGQRKTSWRFTFTQSKFMELRIKKSITMDFELLESAEVLDMQEKAARATNGTHEGMGGMLRQIKNALAAFFRTAVSAGFLLAADIRLVLAIAFFSVLFYLVLNYIKKIDKETVWDALMPFWRKRNYFMWHTANFNSAKDIRLFSMKGWLAQKYRKLNDDMHEYMKLNRKHWIICNIVIRFIVLADQIVIYAWLITSVLYRGMSMGDFVLYLAVTGQFFGGLSNLLDVLTELKNKSRQVNDFRSFVELEDDNEPGATVPRPKSGEGNKPGVSKPHPKLDADIKPGALNPFPALTKYDIAFENVSFKYRGSENYALKDMSLKLNTGSKLAIVGLNGAGKTTFVKLLCRLYKPTKGRILLNGTDIQHYNKEEYFKLFAPLFQQVVTFAFPISQNVSMLTREETDLKRAEACLRLAGLGEKLDTLSGGVNTELLKVLYDEGIDLSGGENQKLALARALYKDSPVIVLDEPTSALDALAEYKLYMDFNSMIGSKTAIYISHRLSSTKFCDNVAMFADGQLCEYGPHDFLIQKGGKYASLFALQAQYYRDGYQNGGGGEEAE
ncbi:MAG: ABC transporter ATP-binding protein/permease [Clostridiales bacterium]|jgi:ABC-type multidrug transport system fused ATPase/permease subunit|nr:ABC transporter ATP-binding protein/permease [Clostridiales bacterium]